MFSTKTEGATWFRPRFWQRLSRRFFGDHDDMSPEAAAELLGGKIVYLARGKAEWVAVLEIEQPTRLATLPNADCSSLREHSRERGANQRVIEEEVDYCQN